MMTTPYYVPPNRESVQQTTSTFWAGLFDFSFTRFITLKFIRVHSGGPLTCGVSA